MFEKRVAFHTVEEMSRCVFCGKKKSWRSDIIIVDKETKLTLDEVSVCPRCRRTRTVGELYEKVGELKAAELRTIMETHKP